MIILSILLIIAASIALALGGSKLTLIFTIIANIINAITFGINYKVYNNEQKGD